MGEVMSLTGEDLRLAMFIIRGEYFPHEILIEGEKVLIGAMFLLGVQVESITEALPLMDEVERLIPALSQAEVLDGGEDLSN